MSNDLRLPLNELNTWLSENGLHIDLVVIGAFAIHLHGHSNRMTMDIDTIKPIEDSQVIEQINKIGDKYGLPLWLNDQAENLIMPAGFETRLSVNSDYSNIKLSYVSRIDLIKLKVAAYFYRGDTDPKDKDDLVILKMNYEELLTAIQFVEKFHAPETDKFQNDFKDRVTITHRELRNACK
jgi:hypothetical protein